MSRFAKGDRVQRRWSVYEPESEMMYGEVISVYAKTSIIDGVEIDYPELYVVRWDDEDRPEGIVKRGYLPHGLEFEEKENK